MDLKFNWSIPGKEFRYQWSVEEKKANLRSAEELDLMKWIIIIPIYSCFIYCYFKRKKGSKEEFQVLNWLFQKKIKEQFQLILKKLWHSAKWKIDSALPSIELANTKVCKIHFTFLYYISIFGWNQATFNWYFSTL